MPKRIQFEGVTHEFPDDFTDDEIGSALGQKAAPKSTPEQPGFVSRGWDASIGGLVESAKAVWGKGIVRVADEAGTAMAKRFNENPLKLGEKDPNPTIRTFDRITSLPTRAVDAAFGPVRDLVVDDFKAGNYAGSLGTIAGTAATAFAPAALSKLLSARAASKAAKASTGTINTMAAPAGASAVTPMQRAVGYAEREGIPTTVGERSGSKMLQGVERASESAPGSSSIAEDFYNSRNQAIQGKGKSLAKQAGTVSEDNTAAAEAVVDRIQGRTTVLKDWYKRKYNSVEQSIERNRMKLQGEQDAAHEAAVKQIEKSNRGEMAYINQRRQLAADAGQNPEIFQPKLQEIPEAPAAARGAEVNMKQIKANLQKVFDELTDTLPPTQREASAGYQRLKSIVEGDDIRNALDLDKDLGEIKRVLRSESKDYAPTQSGRYAAKVIGELEGGVQSAIEKAGGPKAVDDLLKARSGVKEMHRTLDALDELLPKGPNGEIPSPVNLFNSAVREGDKNLNKLIEIRKRAPKAVEEIAATYAEGALRKMSGEGATADMTASVNQWKRLGPRTKAELYGPDLTKQLDDFFDAAPRLVRDMNKSGTANQMAAQKVLGSGALMLGAFTGGFEGVLMGTGAAAAGAGSARAIAKWLFKPGNANDLKNAMRYANDPKTSSYFMKRLSTAVEKDGELLAVLQTANSDKSSLQGQGRPQEAGQQR